MARPLREELFLCGFPKGNCKKSPLFNDMTVLKNRNKAVLPFVLFSSETTANTGPMIKQDLDQIEI